MIQTHPSLEHLIHAQIFLHTFTTTMSLMIREGEPNATLAHLSTNPRQLLGGPLHTYADGR